MIKTRLIGLVPDSQKFIAANQTIQKWMPKEQALEVIQDQMWAACVKTGKKFSAITKHRCLRGPFLRIFARTETLGCGGKCCDFHIYKENAK